MLERKEVILSGIINGKPHNLDDQLKNRYQ